MDTATILTLLKARLGISSNVRDTFLTAIIQGVIKELESEKGIKLESDNMHHIMFIVNYSEWKYSNRDSSKGMPKNLQWDLRNLFISAGGENV